MNELQFLKDLKTDIDAKIAEIEGSQSPVKWEPKGGEWYVSSCGIVCKSLPADHSRKFGTERETQEQARHAAEWMRKFNRLMCWFEENAPGHEVSIEFYSDSAGIRFTATPKIIDDLRTKIRDGVVEL
jgi:transcription initiation factor TFIIIB Brf1 subunit/transcription initiation factor TFIIB